MAVFLQHQALYARGKYAEAEPFARKALELDEAEFGTDHETYATQLNNLALLYRAQGRYGETEPLSKRALAIFEKVLGPDQPFVGQSLHSLEGLYKSQDRYGGALARILKIHLRNKCKTVKAALADR